MATELTLDALSRKAEPRGGPFTVEMDGEVVYTELEWESAVDTVIDVYPTAESVVSIRNYKNRIIVKVPVNVDDESNEDVTRQRDSDKLEDLADAILSHGDNSTLDENDGLSDNEDEFHGNSSEFLLYGEDRLIQSGFFSLEDAISTAHRLRGSGFEGELRIEDDAGATCFLDDGQPLN